MKVSLTLTWCAVAILGLGLASCNRDKETSSDATDGKESVVRLTIYDQRPTRGTNAEETATTEESAFSGNVKVIVFHSDGTFEDENSLSVTGSGNTWTTDNFTLSAGTKYIYVFFNDNSRNDIPSGSGKTRVQFEQSTFDVAFDGSSVPDIATNNSFLIGTLYGATEVVAGGGTATSPVSVALSVGRAVSKVNLAEVTDATNGGMLGTFSTYSYRIGSLAKKLYAVGQYTTTDPNKVPPAAGGDWTAFSAVHNEAPETVPSTYNTAAFLQYTAVWKSPATAFYVTENTTAEDGTGFIYYGNTSYVQLKSKYTPDATEVLDPKDLSTTTTLDGSGDFWTVQLVNGERVIVGSDPSVEDPGDLDSDIDQTQPYYKYEGGVNYHKFAIYDDDPSLGMAVQKYSVLRNTYYEYKITDIRTLGSYTDQVDPKEPIPTDTEVELVVTIKPWFKIADDSVVL